MTKPLSSEEKRKRKRQAMLAKFNNQTWAKCRDDVAKTFQKLVRMEAADDNGNCTCITCGRTHGWNSGSMQAGHFHSRRHSSLLWHEKNVHSQCVYCNNFLAGNMTAYARFMSENYTTDELEEMERLKTKVKGWTREEVVDIRMGFMDRIKKQEIRLTGTE